MGINEQYFFIFASVNKIEKIKKFNYGFKRNYFNRRHERII